jgi:hypothetical protein
MLNSLVGWVELAESQLLTASLVSLPDYIRIAESLNPTPNLTLSSYSELKLKTTKTIPGYETDVG